MVDLENGDIKAVALAYRCLAHPSGLALSHDEKNLFVSETCENRIIRFVLTNSGVYAFRYLNILHFQCIPSILRKIRSNCISNIIIRFSLCSTF